MRNFTFFGSAVLYLIAIFLAYWNRDSEKVLTTFMVGLTALIGSLLAVVVFGAEPPIRKAFSTAIMIRSQDYLPYEDLPYSALPMGIVIDAREKLKAHPELIAEARKEGFANMLYQNLLQRSVVGLIAEAAQGPGGPNPAKMVEVMTRHGLVLAPPKAPAA